MVYNRPSGPLDSGDAKSSWAWHIWGMPSRSSKPPMDTNQLAKLVVDMATGSEPIWTEDGKNPAAVLLGKLGGLKGGAARAASLSPKKRSAIARKAAAARWKKHD